MTKGQKEATGTTTVRGGRLDFSIFGYMSDAIAKRDINELRRHIKHYTSKGSVEYLNATTKEGKSLIDLALDSEDPDIIALILTFPGIDLERENPKTKKSGRQYMTKLSGPQLSPILNAAFGTLNIEPIRILIESGQLNDIQLTKEGLITLMNAYASLPDDKEKSKRNEQFIEIVKLLKNNINKELLDECVDRKDNSLLHMAVELDDQELLSLLLEKKPDLEKGKGSVTPLKLAVMNNRVKTQEALVAAGAKMNFDIGVTESKGGVMGWLGATEGIRKNILKDAIDEKRWFLVSEILTSDQFGSLKWSSDGKGNLDEIVISLLSLPDSTEKGGLSDQDKGNVLSALFICDMRHNIIGTGTIKHFLDNINRGAAERNKKTLGLLLEHNRWKHSGKAESLEISQDWIQTILPRLSKLKKGIDGDPDKKLFDAVMRAAHEGKSLGDDRFNPGGIRVIFQPSQDHAEQLLLTSLNVGSVTSVSSALQILKEGEFGAFTKKGELVRALAETTDDKFAATIDSLSAREMLTQSFIQDLFSKLKDKDDAARIKFLADKCKADKRELSVDLLSLYKNGKLKALQACLEKKLGDINAQDEDGNTLLHLAAGAGHVTLFRQLLAKDSGINLSLANKRGATPLAQLCISKADDATCLELKGELCEDPRFNPEAEVEAVKLDWPYFAMAYRAGHTRLGLSFCEVGFGTQERRGNDLGDRSLKLFILAAEKDDEYTMKRIIEMSRSLPINRAEKTIHNKDYKNPVYATLLARMCRDGRLSAIKVLLQDPDLDVNNGFRYDLSDDESKYVSPIELVLQKLDEELAKNTEADSALVQRYKEIIKELALDPRTDLKVKLDSGCNLLHALFSHPNIDKNELLERESGIDMKSRDQRGYTLLMTAIEYNCDSSVFNKLIDRCTELDIAAVNQAKQTALIIAASSKMESSDFQKLVERYKGTDKLMLRDSYQNTALHYAIASGDLGRVTTLLTLYKEKGFKLDKKAVPAAYSSCNREVIELIKRESAQNLDLNYIDDLHGSALHCVVSSGNEGNKDLSKELIENAQIDVNSRNKHGVTPLMIAVQKGDYDNVKLLMQRMDLDVNLTDKHGNTALMIACQSGRLDIIRALLSNPNINVHARNADGINALLIASHKVEDVEVKAEAGVADVEARSDQANTGEKKSEKRWTSNPAAVKMLVDHGADPNSGYVGISLQHRLIRVIAKVSLLTFVSRLTSWFFPPAQYAAELTRDVLNAQAIGREIGEFLAQKVRDLSNSGQIDLENTCLIGNFNISRAGIVTHGQNLKSAMSGNNLYRNFDRAIYNIEKLREVVATGTNAASRYEMHLTLLTKYAAVQSALESSWAPWTRYSLNKIAKDILEADNEILYPPVGALGGANGSGVGTKGTMDANPGWKRLSRIINTNSAAKVASFLKNASNGSEIKEILEKIVKQEIVVDPKLYYAAHQIMREYALQARSKKWNWNPFERPIQSTITDAEIGQIRGSYGSLKYNKGKASEQDDKSVGAHSAVNSEMTDKVADVVGKVATVVATGAALCVQREDAQRVVSLGITATSAVAGIFGLGAIVSAGALAGAAYGIYHLYSMPKDSTATSDEFEKLCQSVNVTGTEDIPESTATLSTSAPSVEVTGQNEYVTMMDAALGQKSLGGLRTFVEKLQAERAIGQGAGSILAAVPAG